VDGGEELAPRLVSEPRLRCVAPVERGVRLVGGTQEPTPRDLDIWTEGAEPDLHFFRLLLIRPVRVAVDELLDRRRRAPHEVIEPLIAVGLVAAQLAQALALVHRERCAVAPAATAARGAANE
jgi:hypothetical protein